MAVSRRETPAKSCRRYASKNSLEIGRSEIFLCSLNCEFYDSGRGGPCVHRTSILTDTGNSSTTTVAGTAESRFPPAPTQKPSKNQTDNASDDDNEVVRVQTNLVNTCSRGIRIATSLLRWAPETYASSRIMSHKP